MSDSNSSHLLLSAVNLASKKLAGAASLDSVLPEVLGLCVEAAGAEGGTIYIHNKDAKSLAFRHVLPESSASALKFTDIAEDYGIAGQAFTTRQTIISTFEPQPETQFAQKTGLTVRSMITVPLMMQDEEPIGVVQLINKKEGNFDLNDQSVLETVSAVSTLAYLNVQLLADSTRASQLLGMGQVAHDIKNMAFALEANLTYSGHTVESAKLHASDSGDNTAVGFCNDISEMLCDLGGSVERIKRYSMLVSDLSAGKALVPSKSLSQMSTTIKLSTAYMESDARKRHIELIYDIQEDAQPNFHDEMYLFRIVQNVVSNAIKAVGESREDGGVVRVCYRQEGATHYLEVTDNGPGMTEEVAQRILGGNAKSVWAKSSGSGWGTKIVLELAATHDAKISIDSQVGKGSTFRIAFPHCTS